MAALLGWPTLLSSPSLRACLSAVTLRAPRHNVPPHAPPPSALRAPHGSCPRPPSPPPTPTSSSTFSPFCALDAPTRCCRPHALLPTTSTHPTARPPVHAALQRTAHTPDRAIRPRPRPPTAGATAPRASAPRPRAAPNRRDAAPEKNRRRRRLVASTHAHPRRPAPPPRRPPPPPLARLRARHRRPRPSPTARRRHGDARRRTTAHVRRRRSAHATRACAPRPPRPPRPPLRVPLPCSRALSRARGCCHAAPTTTRARRGGRARSVDEERVPASAHTRAADAARRARHARCARRAALPFPTLTRSRCSAILWRAPRARRLQSPRRRR